MSTNIHDWASWKEVAQGIYSYEVEDGMAYYEIIVMDEGNEDLVFVAEAELYISYEWENKKGGKKLKREWMYEGTVDDCMLKAIEDYQKKDMELLEGGERKVTVVLQSISMKR